MAASSVCSPSRAALLTGCYPKRVGLHKGVLFPRSTTGLHPDELTLADHLKQHGYATACYGKWHLGHHPEVLPTAQGFDRYFGIPYSNDMNHPANQDKPEGGVDGMDALWNDPESTLTKWKVPLIENEKIIEQLDTELVRVFDTLRELKLAKTTYVIFATDNGPWLPFKHHAGSAGSLRDGKMSTFEGGQRVPCIIWAPGRIPAGTECKGLFNLTNNIWEKTNRATENPVLVERLQKKMLELDAAVTAGARPVWAKIGG